MRLPILVPEKIFNIVCRALELNKPIPSGEQYLKCFRALNEGYVFSGVSDGQAVLIKRE